MADDTRDFAILRGHLPHWPDKARLARLLRDAGLAVRVGRHSVRVEGEAHFVFNDYGDAPPSAVIEADADTPEVLIAAASAVSRALAAGDLAHSFEIHFPADGDVVKHLRHEAAAGPG